MKLVKEHLNEISLDGSHLNRTGTGWKASIKRWLDEHNKEQAIYTINDDFIIDVKGSINLSGVIKLK